jgi:hypothetical protein
LVNQGVTPKDLAEALPIDGIGFQELKDARLILGPAGLEGDGCQVLGGKYTGAHR